jgi:hypothetical protein
MQPSMIPSTKTMTNDRVDDKHALHFIDFQQFHKLRVQLIILFKLLIMLVLFFFSRICSNY